MKTKKKRSESAAATVHRPAGVSGSAQPQIKKGRRWIFRLAAAFGIPLLLFGLLEGSLRLVGYGNRTAYFVPSPVPGQDAVVENREFSSRYFTPELLRVPKPISFSAVKPPQTLRIFVFGESAAEGDPAPAFGFARILEVLLQDRYPDRKIEVLNTAVTAINSHVILPIAREATRFSGDVWVVYMGNNEVVGPFGAGTVFGPQVPALPLIRANIAIKSARTAQLLDSALRRTRGGAPRVWEGMEMFLEQQVPHDDPRMAAVYSHFERNLSDIVALGNRSGAAVVVSTVGSNLRDCAPLGALHRPGLSAEQRADWEKYYQAGVDLEAGGKNAEAINEYRRAAELDDHFADLHFRLARCFAAAEQWEDARKHFILARDLDTLRFRADTRINEIIRRTAGEAGSGRVRLADAAAALARESAGEIPGEEWFYEHVHLTFAGNYQVAKEIAGRVVECLGQEAAAQGPAAGFATMEECARRLGLTDFEKLNMAADMQRRTSRPPFTRQLDHEAQTARREKMVAALRESDRTNYQHSVALYRQAIAGADGDWRLHDNFAGASLQHGDPTNAVVEWKRVMELLPHRVQTYDLAGSTLLEQRRLDEALVCYEQVLRIQPDYADGLLGRGRVSLAQNRHQDAIRDFKRAARLEAHSARVQNHLGIALLQSGNAAEAEKVLRAAERSEPDFLAVRMNLGTALMDQGKTEAAIAHYEKLAQDHPDNSAVRLVWGRALAKQGKTQEAIRLYGEAVRVQPNDFEARYTLGTALIREQRLEEARDHFATAIKLRPDSHESRLNYATILASEKRTAEAIAQFRQLLELKPGLIPAHLNLGIALMEQGRMSEAALQFEEVLRADPGHARARQLLKSIR